MDPDIDEEEQGAVPESEEEEFVENEADRGFIDDEGVPEAEQYGSDDGNEWVGNVPEAEEAPEGEEEDEIDNLMKKKKRKKEMPVEQVKETVEDMLSRMEAAAEADKEAHARGKPALQKLKLLPTVEPFLAQRAFHETIIAAGGLGVLKAWLQPHEVDGSLPSLKVRTAILKALQHLPIDTGTDGGIEALKGSRLGRVVMLLSKFPDESASNKKIAQGLVNMWSRPIFMDPDAEAAKKVAKLEHLKEARISQVRHEASQPQPAQAAGARKARRGEEGYRWHASIPQASKLDYVQEPVAQVAFQPRAGGGKAAESQFNKKMREIARKHNTKTARAMVPSAEGRGIVVYET